MLKKTFLLKKQKDFDRVFKEGKDSSFNKFLGIKSIKKTEEITPRFGIVVNSKVSKKAVDRNKIKRQIKAVLKENLDYIADSKDYVIIILPPTKNLSFSLLKQELINNFKKLSCFNKN